MQTKIAIASFFKTRVLLIVDFVINFAVKVANCLPLPEGMQFGSTRKVENNEKTQTKSDFEQRNLNCVKNEEILRFQYARNCFLTLFLAN